MLNIVVLVSGGGTNLQALIDAQERGDIKNGNIVRVIGSKSGIFALERARSHNIQTQVIARKDFESQELYDTAIGNALAEAGADLIVLAGFLSILGKNITETYNNRVINVHPSLIPSFCGKGFYGLHVHEAALEYGVRVTGATVHFVSPVVDGGPIILQKAVEVCQDDTPETLQRRVMEQAEWNILPKAVSLFCEGRLKVIGGKVEIMPSGSLN